MHVAVYTLHAVIKLIVAMVYSVTLLLPTPSFSEAPAALTSSDQPAACG